MTDLSRIKQNVAKMAGMNAPEADIDGYIASEGVTVDDVRNHQATAQQAPQNQGIGSRITQDYANRLGEGQQAIDAYNSGQQGALLTGVDYLGKVGFGTAADAAGEAAKSAASYAPQGLKDAVSSGVSAISNSPAGDAARYVGGQYQDFAQRHPDAARHAEAIANIGSVLAPEFPIKGTSLADTAVGAAKKTGAFLKEAGQDLIKAPEGLPIPVKATGSLAKQAKAAASADYDVFESIGGGLHPDQVSKFSADINSLRPKDPAKAAIWDRGGVKDSIDTINSAVSGGELSFSGAQALRADVNNQLKMAYMAGDGTKASHLMQIKDKLTDVLTNPENASHLEVAAKNAWQSANHEFAKGSLLEDLELIAAKASGKAQPANSLDTAINNFLLNKKSSSALLPNERAALEDVVAKTQKGELLRASAGRIMPAAGAALGGVPGFLVGHYGSQLSRTTAEALKLKKLDRVYELINNRAAPEALTHKPPLMLGYDRRGTLERGIEQRRAYEASKGQSSAPILQDAPKKQLLLPSPASKVPSEFTVSPGGAVKSKTYSERLSEALNAEQRNSVGLTGDIDKLNFSKAQRAKLEEALSRADMSAAEAKKAQEDLLYGLNKTKIREEIDKHSSDETAMARALLKARRKNK